MRIAALVPVKGFASAKQRLSPVLGPRERALLAEAMMRDVLKETVSARGLEGVFVVTGDGRASEVARSMGIQVFHEQEERGETEAVVGTLAGLQRSGLDSVLVLPADMPLLRSGDVELLLELPLRERWASPFALLVPSRDRLGTNALLLSPPDLIPLRFGYDSFCYHLSEAAARGARFLVLENERIGLDIDDPSDLEALLASAPKGETRQALIDMGLLGTAERHARCL